MEALINKKTLADRLRSVVPRSVAYTQACRQKAFHSFFTGAAQWLVSPAGRRDTWGPLHMQASSCETRKAYGERALARRAQLRQGVASLAKRA